MHAKPSSNTVKCVPDCKVLAMDSPRRILDLTFTNFEKGPSPALSKRPRFLGPWSAGQASPSPARCCMPSPKPAHHFPLPRDTRSTRTTPTTRTRLRHENQAFLGTGLRSGAPEGGPQETMTPRWQLDALQYEGCVPRLITGDGTDWRRSNWPIGGPRSGAMGRGSRA